MRRYICHRTCTIFETLGLWNVILAWCLRYFLHIFHSIFGHFIITVDNSLTKVSIKAKSSSSDILPTTIRKTGQFAHALCCWDAGGEARKGKLTFTSPLHLVLQECYLRQDVDFSLCGRSQPGCCHSPKPFHLSYGCTMLIFRLQLPYLPRHR